MGGGIATNEDFRRIAAEVFDGVMAEHGFSRAADGDAGLNYTRRDVEFVVGIEHVPSFGFMIGFRESKRFWRRQRFVEIRLIIECSGHLSSEVGLPLYVVQLDGLRSALEQWREAVIKYAAPILRGDLKMVRDPRVPGSVIDAKRARWRAANLRDLAYEAWKEKQYARLLDLLAEIEGLDVGLTATECERRDVAKKSMGKGGAGISG